MSARIAVITTSYPRAPDDAAGHFVESEVLALERGGHEVQVFAPGPNTARDARVRWLPDGGAFGFPGALPRLRQNPLRAFGAMTFVGHAIQALREAGPFARVQAHFLIPSAWPIAGFAQDTELELVGHGSDVRLFCRLPKWLRTRIATSWLERNARLRVTSQELASRLCAATPELAARLSVAPSPIEMHGVPARAAARCELGLEADRKIALIVARLVPAKRVAIALAQLAQLAQPDALSLIVVGGGPELAALRARFPRVHFTGQLPRPRALQFIAASDVLVSASKDEGAPTVIREARALGVPVVAVRAGDLASWAEHDPGITLIPSDFGAHARQQIYEIAGLRA